MSEENKGTLISVSRTNEGKDTKERARYEFTFSSDSQSPSGDKIDEVGKLIEALEALRGKKVKFDFRVEERQSRAGTTFLSSFVIVKEVIPRDQATTKTYAPKAKTAANKAAAVKAALG